jgi:hypothetical protein
MKVIFSLVALFAASALAIPADHSANTPQIRSAEVLAKLERLERRGCGASCACNDGQCECAYCMDDGTCDWYYDGQRC